MGKAQVHPHTCGQSRGTQSQIRCCRVGGRVGGWRTLLCFCSSLPASSSLPDPESWTFKSQARAGDTDMLYISEPQEYPHPHPSPTMISTGPSMGAFLACHV